MNALEETLARQLRTTADGVHASWDHASSRVERRVRERARRRTATRVGAAVAAGAATVAGLAAVTSSPAGFAPAAGPSTVVTPSAAPAATATTPIAPRYVLGGRTLLHAFSSIDGGDPTATLTFAVYRRPGATSPADPYVMVVTAEAREYGVDDGLLHENGEHRSVGWVLGAQVLDVRTFGIPNEEMQQLSVRLKDAFGPTLPESIDGWERVEVGGRGAARYDWLAYDGVEIHNNTGTDVARLIDDRLSQAHTTERVAVAGHDAILIDVSDDSSSRYWVAWHTDDGLTELDIQGVPRDQVGSILSNVMSLDANGYAALFETTASTPSSAPAAVIQATTVTGATTTATS